MTEPSATIARRNRCLEILNDQLRPSSSGLSAWRRRKKAIADDIRDI
jgi:hypothetical protein